MAARLGFARMLVLFLGTLFLFLALLRLEEAREGLSVTHEMLGATPVTIHRPEGDVAPAPAIVIAHGFAGSRPLMRSFAETLGRAGYVTLSFDYLGHGAHPDPMTGDVTDAAGTTRALALQTATMVEAARALPGTDGHVALLGHSMATDILMRVARDDPEIAATVAVSMFSEVPTGESPRNLRIIVGEWETPLVAEAERIVALATGGPAAEGAIYGDPAAGTARGHVVAGNVEHVGVLYDPEALIAARDWFDLVFARDGGEGVALRGVWIVVALVSAVALGWPLARFLPRLAEPRAGLSGGRFWAAAIGPAVLTPLILWPLPTGFLPVLIADYLALHFGLFGVLTLLAMLALGHRPRLGRAPLALLAGLGAALWTTGALALLLDAQVAAFVPGGERVTLLAAILAGTLAWGLADAALSAGAQVRGAGLWTKVLLLASLGGAVALDLSGLFFLLIILPVIVIFLAVHGLFARWIGGQTGHPAAAGVATGIALAWALAVTFPRVAV
ncbi:MAG: alpha/beta fold hydrolase [Pseudomonadota bacterium]